MNAIFELKGDHFQQIKAIIAERPYRVKCIETSETKDSAFSFEDAADMIVQAANSMKKNMKEIHSKDREYVKRVFTEALIGKKKCECNASIEKNAEKTCLAENRIAFVGVKDDALIYETDYFRIMALFENGFQRGVTKIEVKNKEKK